MLFSDTFSDLVKTDLANGQVPALMGRPGIGKSSFVEALATDLGTQCWTLPCNQLADKSDLTGARLVPTPDGQSYYQVFFPHQVVAEAIAYASANPNQEPILFFDEVNRAPSDVTSAVLTMITLRRLGKEKLPNNLRIMIAGNDQGNVTTLDDASLSRFVMYRVEPSARTLMDILGDELHPAVRAVLTQHPHTVFQTYISDADTGDDDDDDAANLFADETEGLHQITTPRTIEGVNKWLRSTPVDRIQGLAATPSDSFDGLTMLDEVIRAYVGETGFATLLVSQVLVSMSNGPATPTGPTLTQPPEWNRIVGASTIDDLKVIVEALDPTQAASNLVYALHSPKAAVHHVKALAKATPSLSPDEQRKLLEMAVGSSLAKASVACFNGLKASEIAPGLSQIQSLLQTLS